MALSHTNGMGWTLSAKLRNPAKLNTPVKHLPDCASDPGLRGSFGMPKILRPDLLWPVFFPPHFSPASLSADGRRVLSGW